MFKLESYTKYIEAHLDEIELPSEPRQLYDPIRYFLSIGGKRIRPILTLLGAEMFGSTKEEAIYQALSIEVFHNFTLIHDDIMDEAPLRRGSTTVHEKWNTNVGILSGDVMMIKGYQLLSKVDSEKLPQLLDIYNQTAIEICEGQQLDMDFESRTDVSIDEYIEMIRLKTSVLLGSALRIGAIIGNASNSDQKHLEAFGENIGIAFQIQDDILDLYANPDKFGKQIGGDVIANKKTLLYLTALKDATLEQIEVLNQLQNENDIELKVSRTRELFDQLDVRSICKLRMEEHYNKAMQSLQSISTASDSKKQLSDLAVYLMNRDT